MLLIVFYLIQYTQNIIILTWNQHINFHFLCFICLFYLFIMLKVIMKKKEGHQKLTGRRKCDVKEI